MFITDKKASSAISIVLIVILSLALVISTLIIFLKRADNSEFQVLSSIAGNVNLKKEIINFNIQQIFNRVSENSDSKEAFIDNFNNELNKYIRNGEYIIPELSQLKDQLDEVSYSTEKISVDFIIEIHEKAEDGSFINYKYTETFTGN